jgi:hypothetical protein
VHVVESVPHVCVEAVEVDDDDDNDAAVVVAVVGYNLPTASTIIRLHMAAYGLIRTAYIHHTRYQGSIEQKGGGEMNTYLFACD